MKRVFGLIIVLSVFACSTKEQAHRRVFRDFSKGVEDCDLALIRKVSTETTTAMVEQLLRKNNQKGRSRVVNQFVNIATRQSNLHSEIIILRDSISNDGFMAWIWFEFDNSAEELVAPLVKVNGSWLVDLPILDTHIP